MSPDVLNLLPSAVGQQPPQIVYGQVSQAQPAPTSFTSTLFVTIPQWQPDYNWQFTGWPAGNGGTLPAQGAAVMLAYDDQSNMRVVWWAGMYTAPSASGAAGGDLSGSYPNPTVAKVKGTTVPLTTSSWTAPTLINSWVNVTTAAYLKDPIGFVHLKGRIKSGASGTVAFVLPAGYRPGATDYYSMIAQGVTLGTAIIDTSGNVTVVTASGTSPTDIGMGGITFLAEN